MPAVTPQRPNYNRPNAPVVSNLKRVRVLYGVLLILTTVFVIRLFYLQVIKHDFYKTAARDSQLKEYQVPAERGMIYAHDGDQITPLVLNEKKYTLFADPVYIKDPLKEAAAVAEVINGKANDLAALLKTPNTRYVVLAKKLSKRQAEKIDKLKLLGIGTREEIYRTYPQNSLAAQLLGFVNDDGKGQYGVEEAADEQLRGRPGQLKAITDASGVPLVSNRDNIVTPPEQGKKIQLTIDISMQRQVEDLLKAGLGRSKSNSGSVVVMEAKTGAIKAMANYPTYQPAKANEVKNLSLFSNAAVSSPLEVGSIMKPLTTAAALDLGVVTPETTYMDPARVRIGDAVVSNIEEDGGPGVKSVADILQMSLNTGAVYLLKQMGGGSINSQARSRWHNYLTDRYGLGKATGIEQSGEASGEIAHPEKGYGLEIQYANMSFGQGMSATILQMAAAFSSIVNGGTYHQPYLVESTTDGAGKTIENKPKPLRRAVSKQTSQQIVKLMKYVFDRNHVLYGMPVLPAGYLVGGKTGTAQIPNLETGGYYEFKFNGTFAGFVGGDEPEYMILVRVNEPKIFGYAGSRAAAPLFSTIVRMMINNYGINPN